MASTSYEPVPRYGHISQVINEKVLVYSGRSRRVDRQQLASTVDVFDVLKEEWVQETLTGQTPSSSLYRAASCSVNNNLYFFGGRPPDNYYSFNNSLFKISYEDGRYRCYELSGSNAGENPMPKGRISSGLFAFGSTGDFLGLAGGYYPSNPSVPGSSFIKDRYSDGGGWTNEFHVYNLKEGSFAPSHHTY